MRDPKLAAFDQDAVLAAIDLVGRTGATGFEFGYLHEHVPTEEAAWYAHAQYRGARITEENHRGPVEATEALARRLLVGGMCTHCRGLITLSSSGAFAYKASTLIDGTTWNAEQAASAPQCRWTRVGAHWKRGCERPAPPATKASRKKRRRRRG